MTSDISGSSRISAARWVALVLWAVVACDKEKDPVATPTTAKRAGVTSSTSLALFAEGATTVPPWSPLGCVLHDHTPCAWLDELRKASAAFPKYVAALEKLGWTEALCDSDGDVVAPNCMTDHVPCWQQLVTSELARPEMKPGGATPPPAAPTPPPPDDPWHRKAKDKSADIHHGFVDVTPSVKVTAVAEQVGATGLLIRPCRDGTICEEAVRSSPASAGAPATSKCGSDVTCGDSIFHQLPDGSWEALDTTADVMGRETDDGSIGGEGPCTGVLVHRQYVLTARHCACGRTPSDEICGKQFDDLQFVLGFTDAKKGRGAVSFAKANVIAVESVVGRPPKGSDDRVDWAILRLEKPLPASTPVVPLVAPPPDSTKQCTPLYTIGHPRGRASSFAGARPGEGIPWAWITYLDHPLTQVNLDLTLGNSGSPVFALADGAAKGELVGIVVRAWSRTLDLINLEGLCPTEGCAYIGYGNYMLAADKFVVEADLAICEAECNASEHYCDDVDAEYRSCCVAGCNAM